jgi:hypothetical protein
MKPRTLPTPIDAPRSGRWRADRQRCALRASFLNAPRSAPLAAPLPLRQPAALAPTHHPSPKPIAQLHRLSPTTDLR